MGRVTGAVFVLSLAALAPSCGGNGTPAPAPPKSGRPIDQQSELQMTAMHVQSYGDQGLDWEMQAPFGEVFTRKNVMRVVNLTIQMFDNGQKSTDISADSGLMSTAKSDPLKQNSKQPEETHTVFGVKMADGDMYLSGNVVMISTDGSKMLTDWVHYHKKQDVITSTAPVTIERKDSVTHGIGMEASADMTRVHIFHETLVIPDQPAGDAAGQAEKGVTK